MTFDAIIHALTATFTSGAYLPFALLLAYGVIRYLTDETHVLGGKAGVVAAAVIAGLSQLVPILVTGKLPDASLVMGAIMTTVGLYIHPVAQPKAA